MKLKVLQLVTSLDVGGLERFVITLTAELRGAVTSYLFCLSHEGLLHSCVSSGTITSVGNRSVNDKLLDMRILRALIRHVKTERIDIIHCHSRKAYIYGLLLSILTRRPLIVSVHGLIPTAWRWRRKFLERIIMNYAHCVISVSDEIASQLCSVYNLSSKSTVTFKNGVNCDDYYPVEIEYRPNLRKNLDLPVSGFICGTIGRVVRDKNYSLLVRAFGQLVTMVKDAYLVIVGDGDELSNISDIIRELNLEEKVFLVGSRNSTLSWYQSFDVFVLSSITEGTPMSLLEAGACGIPSVVTAVGGMPQVIETDVNGIIVESENESALFNALYNMYQSPRELSKMGINARKIVKSRYSLSESVHEHFRLYQELVDISLKK